MVSLPDGNGNDRILVMSQTSREFLQATGMAPSAPKSQSSLQGDISVILVSVGDSINSSVDMGPGRTQRVGSPQYPCAQVTTVPKLKNPVADVDTEVSQGLGPSMELGVS